MHRCPALSSKLSIQYIHPARYIGFAGIFLLEDVIGTMYKLFA